MIIYERYLTYQMDYISSDSRQWAFTLRKTSKPSQVTCEDYLSHVNKFVKKLHCKLESYVFETTGGLHMHGIIDILKSVDKKRFRVRGWHWYMEELYNYAGWEYYMLKEQYIARHEPTLVNMSKDNTSSSLDALGTQIIEEKTPSPREGFPRRMFSSLEFGMGADPGLKPVIVSQYNAKTR